jgi:hypothetical protein
MGNFMTSALPQRPDRRYGVWLLCWLLVFGCVRPTHSLGSVELSYSTFKQHVA